MDFSFSDEQQSLRELAAKIFTDLVTHDRLRELERSGECFDRALWAELGKSNLLGIAIDEEHGGMGMGFLELSLLLEEAGRTVAPVPLVPTLVMGALPIAEFGSDAQKAHFLSRVASGDSVLTAALLEPGSEDPCAPEAVAARDGDGWRLDGKKLSVPYAALAERILVPARTDTGLGLFLLDPAADGVGLEAVEATSHEPQSHVVLTGARVDADDVLAGPDEGAAAVAWLALRAKAALCAVALGVADEALRITARYTTEREQFDRPIGSFQAVHQRAADAYIAIEAARLNAWQASSRIAAGVDAADVVAVAKYWAAEAGHVATYAAIHLHGGMGVDVDYPVHRHYLWARQIELTLGSAHRQLAEMGAEIAAG
jgi:alkylation response protein AidB-like acyl-CoA dehydrogenase